MKESELDAAIRALRTSAPTPWGDDTLDRMASAITGSVASAELDHGIRALKDAAPPAWRDETLDQMARSVIEREAVLRRRAALRRWIFGGGVLAVGLALLWGLSTRHGSPPSPQPTRARAPEMVVIATATATSVVRGPLREESVGDARVRFDASKTTLRWYNRTPGFEVVALERGAATFETRAEPGGLLRVRADGILVENEGTRFSVARGKGGRVMVRAESGAARVRMWMPREMREGVVLLEGEAREFESPTEAPPTLEEETRVVMEMVNRADRVKAASGLDDATPILRDVLERFPHHRLAASAAHRLGRWYRDRHQSREAIDAFRLEFMLATEEGLLESAVASECAVRGVPYAPGDTPSGDAR